MHIVHELEMLQGLNQLLLQSVMLFRRDFEISQFHAFYHHMSVYFGNLVKKKKADAEMYKIAIRIAICSEFQTDYIFDTDSL